MFWGRTADGARATAQYLLRNAYLMVLVARDRRVPWAARGIAVGSAGYVFFPFNLIPDYVPVLGFIDDLGVIWLGLFVARLLVPKEVMAEHRARLDQRFGKDERAAERRQRLGRAFGVDPMRREYYSLRQSRYDALAQQIDVWAGALAGSAKLRLLIIGCGVGTELRHLEARPNFTRLVLSGANIDERSIYRREIYETFFVGNFMLGYPEIPSHAYDVVVCEQVLEHLDEIGVAISTLERVLKPGGKAIIGVPIFPPPLHLVRAQLVPRVDALIGRRRSRGHRQAFSLGSFLAAMRRHSGLALLRVRGFRIISGGLLRPLENYRWWWKANRRLGELVPALCIEIQALFEKPARPLPERSAPR